MRVFIAIDLPEDIKEKISSFYKDVKGVNGKFVEKENLHITLKFLGELQPNFVEKIKEKLNEIKFRKFTISISGIGTFNRRVLWFGIKKGYYELLELHKLIDEKLNELKIPKDFEFSPHITILRIKNIFDNNSFDKSINNLKDIYIGEFIVDRFKLKQSILRPQGPLYLDVKEYLLE